MAPHAVLKKHYKWPAPAVNLYMFIMLLCSATCLGMYSWLIVVSKQINSLMPWLFPFMVATSCITIVFLLVIWYLIVTFKLFADVMILGNVIMFALWLTGLIETGIQLFGQNSLNQTCIEFVFKAEYKGPSLRTLAWLEQASICNCWRAVFSFELIACVIICFIFWLSLSVRRHYHAH